MTNLTRSLVLGCSVLALAACGPTDIASPGSGGNITINNPPAPAPSPSPSPSGPTGVVPATGCPSVATDSGTIKGPTGEWRVCSLPAMIPQSLTLPKVAGVLYRLNGRTDVGCDGGTAAPTTALPYTSTTIGCTLGTPAGRLTADTGVVLNIEPGVIIYADTGQSWLAVNRGNRINAVGTATAPIVFTSRDNVLGLNTDSSQGQWGGVVLMGRALTTDCGGLGGGGVSATVTAPGTVSTCERATEGSTTPAVFGGNLPADNSGRMSFVQIRYSGFVLSQGIELQSLTGEGVGSGTVLDHIQTVNSSDDGSEWFGGNFGMKYYISVGADDDSLDVDTGAQANFQHVLLVQRSGRGDALMEIDSSNAFDNVLPRTKLTVANFTAISPAASPDNADEAATLFRGNSDVTLVNGLIVAPANECIAMNATTAAGVTAVTLTARSVLLQCGATKYLDRGGFVGTAAPGAVAGQFGTGTNGNNDAFVNTLTNLYVNGTNETALTGINPRPLYSGSNALETFLDNTATWIGAVRTSDTWHQGWTCNSAAANFGTGNSGNCTSLPVT